MKKISIIIILFAINISLKAQICLTTAYYSASGSGSIAITSNDFNNDGFSDIVTADPMMGNAYLFLGNGAGGLSNSITISLDTMGGLPGGTTKGLVSADFNGDGNVDLAIAQYNNQTNIRVMFGNGTGGFPISTFFSAGSYPFSICTADFNGDNVADLATANSNDSTVSVLIGDGTGNFSSTSFFAGNGPMAVSAGDFNGDGDFDLAVARNGNGGGIDSVTVLFGNGTGILGGTASYLADQGPYSVACSDFNGDGFSDIVIANSNSNNVSVFISQGSSGLFNAAVNYTTGNVPNSVVCADLNLDGNPDIASANYSNSVSVLLGTGTGTFSSNLNFTSLAGPWTIISSDFNADGKPDLATANKDANYMAVLLNVVSPNCGGCALNSMTGVPEICMVTADSANNYNYNVIYWDKSSYTNVDSFIVYRKDAISSTYLRIGAVSSDSLSQFVDTAFAIGGPNGGNPKYSSWNYKLAIRDTCGAIGSMSPYHQTMFIQQNGSNFSWNAYTVETGQTNPVTGYSFLRDNNNTGNWQVLVNTTGVSTTDPDHTIYPSGNWRIDALGFNCTPALRTPTTQSRSHSNTTRQISVGITEPAGLNSSIVFYPNPVTNILVIENIKSETIIHVYDAFGRLVIERIIATDLKLDVAGLSEGLYTVMTETTTDRQHKKILIVK